MSIRKSILFFKQDSRIEWIDYAKGIAILLVVLRHVVYGIKIAGVEVPKNFFLFSTEFGANFRMPLFFLLSGFFFEKSVSKWGSVGYFKHKLTTIMYPYLIWSIIQLSAQLIFLDFVNADVGSWKDFLRITYRPRDQFWFLYALFNASIIYLIMSKYLRINAWIILFIAFIQYIISNYFFMGELLFRTQNLFLFFSIGVITSSTVLTSDKFLIISKNWMFFILAIFTFLGEWLYVQKIIYSPFFALWNSIIGSMFIFSLSLKLQALNSNYLKIIRIIGFHSLYIFLLHVIISALVRILLIELFHLHSFYLVLPLAFFSGIFGSLLAYYILIQLHLNLLFKINAR